MAAPECTARLLFTRKALPFSSQSLACSTGGASPLSLFWPWLSSPPSSSQTMAPENDDSSPDFYQQIQFHQAAAIRLTPVEEVSTVLDRSLRGMLSTFSAVSGKDSEAARNAYLKRHPNAFWVEFGDFQFIRIVPKVVRCVSVVATSLVGCGEFDPDVYKAAKVDPIAQFFNHVAVLALSVSALLSTLKAELIKSSYAVSYV